MNRVHGFTLIEVLIAMTLLSIMITVLFASLRICAESWEKGEAKMIAVNDKAIVYNFFMQHLSVTPPLWKDLNDNEPQALSFQGKKNTLQFVSSFPASVGKSGLQLFFISLKNEDHEGVIRVTLTPFFALIDGKKQKEEVDLIRGVRDFSLSYYGADDDTAKKSWRDEWTNKSVLPTLVKIKITLENETLWPEMIVELKVNGSLINSNSDVENSDRGEW